jgi:hypothetical protein
VSLQYLVDGDGQPLSQHRTERFGDTIYDRSRVEDRIRRAQCAILNPSIPAKQFLSQEDVELDEKEVTFSLNRVILQIRGPDVTDLSFCDLPGMSLVFP